MIKEKIRFGVIIGLVISNLLLLSFLFLNSPKHPRHDGPKRLICEKLQFDEGQKKEYQILIYSHQASINKLDMEIGQLKGQLYQQLGRETSSVKDGLLQRISAKQTKIEETHYKHFGDIKRLCRPDQIDRFNALTKELNRLFSKPPRPKK